MSFMCEKFISLSCTYDSKHSYFPHFYSWNVFPYVWAYYQKQRMRCNVMRNDHVEAIRSALRSRVGQPVRLHVVGERNKILNAYGILDGVYNDIFTILVHDSDYSKRYCYTYSEIITKNVAVTPVSAQ